MTRHDLRLRLTPAQSAWLAAEAKKHGCRGPDVVRQLFAAAGCPDVERPRVVAARALREMPAATRRELAELVGCHRRTVQRAAREGR